MDYARIPPSFWTGVLGKGLRGRPEAQVLALYLMTNPHARMTGVYHLPMAYICADTGLPFEGASKGLQCLIEAGFCEYDEASETVFVLDMAPTQIGASLEPADKRAIGLRREFEKMAGTRIQMRFWEVHGSRYGLSKPAELACPMEGASKALPSPSEASSSSSSSSSNSISSNSTSSTSGRARKTSGTAAARREPAPTAAVWSAYSEAYVARYRVAPVDNARVRGMLSTFLKCVPVDHAPHVARTYVESNKHSYVSRRHPVGLLLQDAESLHTEWESGQRMTDTAARQADRTAATGQVFQMLIDEAEAAHAE